MQTPILWSHGIADQTVLFEAGQAGPPFLQHVGMNCEFKVLLALSRESFNTSFWNVMSIITFHLFDSFKSGTFYPFLKTVDVFTELTILYK